MPAAHRTPMSEVAQKPDPAEGSFVVRDCALVAIATGLQASSAREFLDRLLAVESASIYYHFWGNLLEPRFEEREYNNDFASWIRHRLHDPVLAERLAVLDPTDHPDLDMLRQMMVDLIEERLDEDPNLAWARAAEPFEFIRSKIVVFDSHRRIREAAALVELIPQLSPSSIFYHFVDARRREPFGHDDFSLWLEGLGDDHRELCRSIADIDPYFGSLTELRAELGAVVSRHFGG